MDEQKIFVGESSSSFVVDERNYRKSGLQSLMHLDQDHWVDEAKQEIYWGKFVANQEHHYNGFVGKQQFLMSQKKGYKAIQYRDLYYLPSNHSLAQRQLTEYEAHYEIKKHENDQMRFCITVPSHNNVQDNRYLRSMLSILKQDYTNYHIVFIDDFSED